jgi:hypothetical protein
MRSFACIILNLRRHFCGHIKIGNRLYFSVKQVMRICVLDSGAYVLRFFSPPMELSFFGWGGAFDDDSPDTRTWMEFVNSAYRHYLLTSLHPQTENRTLSIGATNEICKFVKIISIQLQTFWALSTLCMLAYIWHFVSAWIVILVTCWICMYICLSLICDFNGRYIVS